MLKSCCCSEPPQAPVFKHQLAVLPWGLEPLRAGALLMEVNWWWTFEGDSPALLPVSLSAVPGSHHVRSSTTYICCHIAPALCPFFQNWARAHLSSLRYLCWCRCHSDGKHNLRQRQGMVWRLMWASRSDSGVARCGNYQAWDVKQWKTNPYDTSFYGALRPLFPSFHR